ncbi:MAG TPA: hypothetical protein VD969_27150 [Symbiobacteriaceae bacterium]|nr:hypothetical protein [Symbiobacteriaceae bacterium]
MIIDPGTLPWRDAYRLMIGTIVPRPIAWVSTVSKEGVNNLAPFSFFTAMAARRIRWSTSRKRASLR